MSYPPRPPYLPWPAPPPLSPGCSTREIREHLSAEDAARFDAELAAFPETRRRNPKLGMMAELLERWRQHALETVKGAGLGGAPTP